MTVDHRRTTSSEAGLAHRMARSLLNAVRPESGVRRLWAWSEPAYIEPGRPYVELWVYADPAGPDAEQRLRRTAAALHTSYPDANIRVHTITSPMLNGHDPDDLVRPGAEEVAFQAR